MNWPHREASSLSSKQVHGNLQQSNPAWPSEHTAWLKPEFGVREFFKDKKFTLQALSKAFQE